MSDYIPNLLSNVERVEVAIGHTIDIARLDNVSALCLADLKQATSARQLSFMPVDEFNRVFSYVVFRVAKRKKFTIIE